MHPIHTKSNSSQHRKPIDRLRSTWPLVGVACATLVLCSAFGVPASAAAESQMRSSARAKATIAKKVKKPRRKVTKPTFPTGARTTPTTQAVVTTPAPVTTQTSTPAVVGSYPPQWDWAAGAADSQPLPAESGTPLIKQIRNGTVIATYTRLGGSGCTSPGDSLDKPDPTCGAFSRSPHSNKRDGDIFEVYPAVYEGPDQQPYIGPSVDNYANYQAGVERETANIIIRGVTVSGRRPVLRVGAGGSNNTLGQGLVYIDKSRNITIENIDLDGAGTGNVGKAGVYLYRTNGVTLRNMRIHGFRKGRTNGIFAAASNRSTLLIDRVQLFDNGGDSGPEHNVYINASDVDPNWTLRMINSYSSAVYYGHLFKSRAQVTILEGNYFKGTLPLAGEPIAESYLVDIPNGGRLTMRNNVLAKNKSGNGSNGIMVNFAAEGVTDGRPLSVLIEHNTFVAFGGDYDDAGHPIVPMNFFWPSRIPGSAGFGIGEFAVRANVFVGFRADAVMKQYNPAGLYRGDQPTVAGFDGLRADFSLANPVAANGTSIVGSPSYRHRAEGGGTRQRATVGAVD